MLSATSPRRKRSGGRNFNAYSVSRTIKRSSFSREDRILPWLAKREKKWKTRCKSHHIWDMAVRLNLSKWGSLKAQSAKVKDECIKAQSAKVKVRQKPRQGWPEERSFRGRFPVRALSGSWLLSRGRLEIRSHLKFDARNRRKDSRVP